MSILLWLLQSFDLSLRMVSDPAHSILGSMGSALAPLFAPCGFGFWQAVVALLTGFIAKEMVVSSLGMFYGFPLAAFSYLVFILLYVPCVAAVSTIAKEMNSRKWTLFCVAWQIGCAYAVSLLVYQLGRLLAG